MFCSVLVLGKWLLDRTLTRKELVLPEGVLLDGIHCSIMHQCMSLVHSFIVPHVSLSGLVSVLAFREALEQLLTEDS